MDEQRRQALALWRYSVLGPLVSARLGHGDRKRLFREAAERLYEHPDGRRVHVSARTIEDWFYRHRKDGLRGLEPKTRADAGSTSIATDLRDLLLRAKREKPRRSINRLIKIIERARRVDKGVLNKSKVYRLLVSAGLSGRPSRAETKERRSFMVEHGGDLWMGDALHGPRVKVGSALRKSYLVSIMDGATRCIVRSRFFLSEGAAMHERLLIEALRINGLVRTYYVDRGSAYMAQSLILGCAELGIHLLHTEPRDPQAKGAIERWHRTWREEVGDELPTEPLTLDQLNAKHWAWVSSEYNERRHTTTGRAPFEHFLSEAEHMRPLPRGIDLSEVFLQRERRKVRADGTVQLHGRRLEVESHLCGQWVELRFHPAEPRIRPRVYADDEYAGQATVLDLLGNATRRRRRPTAKPEPDVEPTGLDPLGDLEREHYRLSDPDQDDT